MAITTRGGGGGGGGVWQKILHPKGLTGIMACLSHLGLLGRGNPITKSSIKHWTILFLEMPQSSTNNSHQHSSVQI